MKVDPDWWKKLIDDIYLVTDARSVCDDDITGREVGLICKLLPVVPGQKILDLFGGHGRHSFELCTRELHENRVYAKNHDCEIHKRN